MSIDPALLPGDYINRAQSMVCFLALVLCESPSQLDIPPLAQEGLSFILGHIEENLKQASHLL